MNNEDQKQITIYDKLDNPIEAARAMGIEFFKSGMFGCTNESQGFMLALSCIAKKIDPFEHDRTYHLMDGRVVMKAHAITSTFLRRGGKIKWIKYDRECAEADVTDYNGNVYKGMKFTLEMAKERGFITNRKGEFKDNWRYHTAEMLRAALERSVINMIDPSITAGALTEDEAMSLSVQEIQTPTEKPANAKVIEKPIEKEPATIPVPETTKEEKPSPIKEEQQKPEQKPEQRKPDQIIQLEGVLEKYEPHATSFLIEKGRITEGQTYRDLHPTKIANILVNPAPLLKAVQERKANAEKDPDWSVPEKEKPGKEDDQFPA